MLKVKNKHFKVNILVSFDINVIAAALGLETLLSSENLR